MTPITRLTAVTDLPQLLRVSEAAIWLDCGQGTVYELIRTGKLESIRVGRLVRVPRGALEKFAGGGTPAPTVADVDAFLQAHPDCSDRELVSAMLGDRR